MRSKNEPETQLRSAMDVTSTLPAYESFSLKKSRNDGRKLFGSRGLATSESAAELETLGGASSSVAGLVSATSEGEDETKFSLIT